MSSLELRGKGLRLVTQMDFGANRRMASGIFSQRISRLRTHGMLQHRMVTGGNDAIRFEALVATIQQRDAADERATFWKRAFFVLAWTAGTASVTLAMAWLKGRF